MTGQSRRDWLRARYVTAKHGLRSVGHAGARLPMLPVYARYTAPRGLPDGYQRIYYYHVRKTGGTSLAHAFLSLGAEDPARVERRMRHPPFCTSSDGYRFVYQDRPLLRLGHYFFGYGHGDAESVQLPGRTFTVTILRDPVERVVSLYRYLVDPRADAGQAFRAPDNERRWADVGFMKFLDRVSPEQLTHQVHMFSRAGHVEDAASRVLSCNRVLFTDTLDDDLLRLGSLLDLPLVPRRVRWSAVNYEPTDAERVRLRELLEPEYRLLSIVRGTGSAAQPRSPRSLPPTDEPRPGSGAQL